MHFVVEVLTDRTRFAKFVHKNIILIGPMGVGKSTVGRQLAKQLKINFIDADQEIEQRTGASINLIFDIEGEPGFREREERLIEELSQKGNIVLATGGGAVLREGNRKNLRRAGIVVYLHAPVDTLLKRTRNSKTRPLLQTGDPAAKLRQLLQERDPLYRQVADIIVDSDRRSAASVARSIIKRIEET